VHNNYYFFRHLTTELQPLLADTVVSECFSQNKDELIIRLEKKTVSYYIKASLSPAFSCISFPENFQRARKNSADLFNGIIGRKVTGIRQFMHERSFAILLSDGCTLLFKMHGNRSNVILFENDAITELFRKNIKADAGIQLSALDREIDWTFATFEKFKEHPSRLYFTFGKLVWRHLDEHGFQQGDTRKKWEMIIDVNTKLEASNFCITNIEGRYYLSLLETGNIVTKFTRAIDAVNEFYYTFTQRYVFEKEKTVLLNALQAKLHSSKNYLEKTNTKLTEITQDTSYKIWADLIMANLNNIKPGSEKVTLANFYHENLPVEIRLKKDLSPQKNAEAFYRKSKNQQIEITRLQQALSQKEKEIDWTETRLKEINAIEDLKSLRSFSSVIREDVTDSEPAIHQPYHEFTIQGFRIWVGKNAQHNDTLTFKLGYKEDLWLHAKDVSGSHVLIKHQAGKKFPKEVIEQAAELAAYNSKRKTETLCPVIVTPRKFVRKRKGDPPGAVVVEREEVILVEPKLP
jgi:predicted ribosome quality control (RQC) complex YloA/Tae2 family protein